MTPSQIEKKFCSKSKKNTREELTQEVIERGALTLVAIQHEIRDESEPATKRKKPLWGAFFTSENGSTSTRNEEVNFKRLNFLFN